MRVLESRGFRNLRMVNQNDDPCFWASLPFSVKVLLFEQKHEKNAC